MEINNPRQPLRDALLERTRSDHSLVQKEADHSLRCLACGHRCRIYEGRAGICKVRFNVDGELRVPWNYVGGLQADPIEKKPFFHIRPGSTALSFGMLGCDLHCAYCQNWFTSQALRDENARPRAYDITAENMVERAIAAGAKTITSTYNEPLITAEWAVQIFKIARQKTLSTAFVSNGNATHEVLEFIRPHVDYYKIDLKSFRDKNYRKLGAVLENVLESIRRVWEMGFWLEIVTLVIPGFNDDLGELQAMADFLVALSPRIPWHLTAFHPDYKMMSNENTLAKSLITAAEVGRNAGLNYIYIGNLPGQVGDWENTRCPTCNTLLVRRHGYRILENRMNFSQCPSCAETIPGVWV